MNSIWTFNEHTDAVENEEVTPYKGIRGSARELYESGWGFNYAKRVWVKIPKTKLNFHSKICLDGGDMCGVCKDDIVVYKYPHAKYCFQIKCYMNRVDEKNKKEEKLVVVREMFQYLSEIHHLFMWNNPSFKKMVIRKLFEFKQKENVREAGVWYRWLFKERMPVDMSTI